MIEGAATTVMSKLAGSSSGRRAKGRMPSVADYSAPTTLKLALSNTWCGQLTPM
jgi:hypothetical protein